VALVHISLKFVLFEITPTSFMLVCLFIVPLRNRPSQLEEQVRLVRQTSKLGLTKIVVTIQLPSGESMELPMSGKIRMGKDFVFVQIPEVEGFFARDEAGTRLTSVAPQDTPRVAIDLLDEPEEIKELRKALLNVPAGLTVVQEGQSLRVVRVEDVAAGKVPGIRRRRRLAQGS
jgi:hypothetical protein